ncbi:MAG: nitroreductase family protein [Chloroflexi bacterium]|nr:nitroreductase family protein [Chloroflexota bacterium]
MNYDEFSGLMKYRRSIRKFKPDPIPDEYITKILDASRYAMSGANAQPWEFIVVKNRDTIKRLNSVWLEFDHDLAWSLELQRIPKYRHPAYNLPDEEEDRTKQMLAEWGDAPVCICVIEDPRKQFGSVLAARSNLCSHSQNVFATTMGHLSMAMHLAVASLGLGSQRVDILVQEPYRQILKYPEPLSLNVIVPVGYRAYEPGAPHRLPLKNLVHHEEYDMSKYIRGAAFLKYLDSIRALGKPGYRVVLGEGKG